MNFLVDAQLPRWICNCLSEHGHDALHTLDAILNQLTVRESRVLVTKDADFVDSLVIQSVPYKLLLISTGNIRNAELERLLFTHLDAIVAGFETCRFIEIDRVALRFHF